jgi:hypothetical protein
MAKNIKKSSVEFAVRETAATNTAYNLGENVSDERKQQHVETCKAIVAFADSHKDIPFYGILTTMAQGSPKKSEYRKGYTHFDAKCAEAVYRMCKAYYKKNGLTDRKVNDVVLRLMLKFYKEVSRSPIAFNTALKASAVLGKAAISRETKFTDLCRNLGIVTAEDKTAA